MSLISRPMLRTDLTLIVGSVLYSFCGHDMQHVTLLLAVCHIFYDIVDNITMSLNESSAQFRLKICMSKSN
jgi:hypothetical protein